MSKLLSKSQTSSKSDNKVYPAACPICRMQTNDVLRMNGENTYTDWYRCNCGVRFQASPPMDDSIFNHKYYLELTEEVNNLVENKTNDFKHCIRNYAPLLEEYTHGRMLLDVGCGSELHIREFQKRGWVCWGIDKNKSLKDKKDIYIGDFLTVDFDNPLNQPEIHKEVQEQIKRKFDVIWMSHSFEDMAEPIKALKKAFELLSEGGMLYISTPDVEIIQSCGAMHFQYWKDKEYFVLWSKRALVRELEKLGFEVILAKRNHSVRFGYFYDLHIIAQKKYF